MEKNEDTDADNRGSPILKTEVEAAIKEIKNGKAHGSNDIPVEFLMEPSRELLNELTKLNNVIYDTGEWPEDITTTIMIPIEKKPIAKKCSNFRTISLISHRSKIMQRIRTKCITSKTEGFLGEDQFGFRKEQDTREAIAIIRTLSERVMKHDKEINIAFINQEKAFD